MHNILLQIIEKKKHDLISSHPEIDLDIFKKKIPKQVRHNNKFRKAILGAKEIALIGEIKLASPKHDSLGSKEEVVPRAKLYKRSGVNAISLITEPHFFKGDISFVSQVKKHVDIPVLQKDFVIDAFQIYQAKQIGSDALLLIARLLDEGALRIFVTLCQRLGIEPVVEINNEADLQKALATSTNIIAVNARNLETFAIDVDAACLLLKKIPGKFIKLGFSGVVSAKEIAQYKNAGAEGVLVGTSLMKANNVSEFVDSLRVLSGATRSFSKHVLVKICATRSLEAAETAAKNGAEFLGMVFTPHTKIHTIVMSVAKKIGNMMKGKINLVGVFQNMPLDVVQKIIKDCQLDYAQFHGDETPEYLSKIKIKTIKAFRFSGDFSVTKAREQMKKYKVDYYLVDRIKQSEGPMLNLDKVAKLAKEFPLIFAGGLNPENVGNVVEKVKPQMVDVASGVETDGQQDFKKIKTFIKNAKEAIL